MPSHMLEAKWPWAASVSRVHRQYCRSLIHPSGSSRTNEPPPISFKNALGLAEQLPGTLIPPIQLLIPHTKSGQCPKRRRPGPQAVSGSRASSIFWGFFTTPPTLSFVRHRSAAPSAVLPRWRLLAPMGRGGFSGPSSSLVQPVKAESCFSSSLNLMPNRRCPVEKARTTETSHSPLRPLPQTPHRDFPTGAFCAHSTLRV
ncbi:hypothetical protein B0H67DRAFT_197270 [Lasiosphaeris hirsuta]|uniref:Uncharacterized protein n=1 Tax=Lasiosphaeris hirsuta TaxID=260670 RepID=A0AA40ARF4_9PEZI|nr:hypothetical protein B0H67DRAFT_197270 [Lasiosphaeris hirsuta]